MPYGGSVNQIAPSDATMMSFGELSRLPSYRSTTVVRLPVALVPGDAAGPVLAGEDRAVVVERVAIREVGRPVELADGAVDAGPAQHPVVRDVAPDDGVLIRDVDRPLGPGRPVREPPQLRPGRHETLEPLVADDAFDGCFGHCAPSVADAGVGPAASVASLRCSPTWNPRSIAVLSRTSTTMAAADAPVTAIATPPRMIVT